MVLQALAARPIVPQALAARPVVAGPGSLFLFRQEAYADYFRLLVPAA
jgi:hypothetical protein